MPNTLASLETDRAKLLHQFLGLGDFRPGSITAVARRCGRRNCHCSQPNDPGHSPQLRLTRRVVGKSVTESFASPAAFQKAQNEVAEYHRFQKLSQQLTTVNESICQLRPLAQETSGWSEQEKKRLLQSIKRSHKK